jgi:hypothetical protein
VRKPVLACLLAWSLIGTCGVIDPQQSSPQSKPHTSPAAAAEKPAGQPQETATAPPEKPTEKHSTLEDRQRLVTVAHKLETAPLDSTLAPEREWAVSWTVAAPDIHVRTCPALLADLRRPRYKYRSEMGAQLLISSAAFLIEHPDQPDSIAVQSVGGMEGVLRAYSAILKTDPQATAKPLDEFLQKQSNGKLAETVREMVKDCH